MNSQKTIQLLLSERLAQALANLHIKAELATITIAADARFGDYQSNSAMIAAKQIKKNPRIVAEQIIEQLHLQDLCEPLEIAGPGFINFRLKNKFLEQRITELLEDPRLGIPLVAEPKTIVIDFSSPNVAKPMHVGHIRSSILGDSLARIARFLGHHVITDNHIGDWGTQFGKVIYGWKYLRSNKSASSPTFAIRDTSSVHELVRLYREVNELEEKDATVKKTVREELVKLQQGDPENLAIWKKVVDISWQEFQRLYELLGIKFDECLGESFYNDALAPLVERLAKDGIAEESEGALCIFFKNQPALLDKPCLIRKADGGFLYATTDLATVEYREKKWRPDAVWYVCGAPQQLHFEQIFSAAHRLGITSDLRHISFGSILGEDRKMMKTRSGENIELGSLLQEAIERAFRLVSEKNHDFSLVEKKEVAQVVGLGALKYADLMQHRMTDYIFSWEKMLSFQGNTAPYLQNAYVRIKSIFRKKTDSEEQLGEKNKPSPLESHSIIISEPVERQLVLQLLQFGDIIPTILIDARPNILCLALFELANSFHRFYELCPILKSEGAIKQSRLRLAELTARALKLGLGLLGIDVPERM
ncbi:MAG: arginine--tRNA ligase [Chthoniobacterales bacterium]